MKLELTLQTIKKIINHSGYFNIFGIIVAIRQETIIGNTKKSRVTNPHIKTGALELLIPNLIVKLGVYC